MEKNNENSKRINHADTGVNNCGTDRQRIHDNPVARTSRRPYHTESPEQQEIDERLQQDAKNYFKQGDKIRNPHVARCAEYLRGEVINSKRKE